MFRGHTLPATVTSTCYSCAMKPRVPSKDIVRQSLQTMLAASEGDQSAEWTEEFLVIGPCAKHALPGPGGLLCAPTLDSVTTVDLQSAELDSPLQESCTRARRRASAWKSFVLHHVESPCW